MTSPPRPDLEEAAHRWLDTADDHGDREIRAALADFVSRRFRGAAPSLRRVHDFRQRLLEDRRPMESLSDRPGLSSDVQALGGAAGDSAPPGQGRLLFHLVRVFSPATVLELGTNIGISAAYIALGLEYGGGGRLTTVEASGKRVELAERTLSELGVEGVELVQGYFDDILPALLERLGRVDMAFMDGNHRLEPTLSYFEQLRACMPPGGLVVLDDIRWSDDMLEAWNRIVAGPGLRTVVDLGRTGLVRLA